MNKRVGLIGLGLMGAPMGHNWLKNGFELTVLPHKNKTNSQALADKGARVAKDFSELCSNSDVIVLMVPTSREVEALARDLKPLIQPKHLVIDMSTSEPSSTSQLHRDFKTMNLRFFDAPVTGGVKGATEGKLTLFLGGPLPWIEEAKPVLEAVSQKQVYFGEAGQGHVAKIINNFICIGNMAVLAEALPLAAKLGLDCAKIFDSLVDGMAASRQLEFYGPQILNGDFSPRFRLSHAFKDMNLAARVADDLGVGLPILQGILSLFETAMAQGLSEENVSALVRPLEGKLGVAFRRDPGAVSPS